LGGFLYSSAVGVLDRFIENAFFQKMPLLTLSVVNPLQYSHRGFLQGLDLSSFNELFNGFLIHYDYKY